MFNEFEDEYMEALARERKLQDRVKKLEQALIRISGCEKCVTNDCYKCLTGEALEEGK